MAKKHLQHTAQQIDDAVEQVSELSQTVNNKQDTIDDLEDIRDGAEKGATALQPVEGKGLSTVADVTVTDGKLEFTKQDGSTLEFEGGGGLPLSVVNGQLCITFNQ